MRLDRVYGYHVERGTLEQLLKSYRTKVEDKPDDGVSWLLLGLLEAQRGSDQAAVLALRKAEETRLKDPLPSYYLGQELVLVGQPEAAALAFERAIARKPNRTDLLDVFQVLGRVYQKTNKDDRAAEVWKRLEQLFPDDTGVFEEQIAAILAEESKPDLALERYEELAKKAADKFRQIQLQIEAADLKVRLGKTTAALADFERLLGELNPESWLYREVRSKVEDVFLKNDDVSGLATYYEGWIKKNPDDVECFPGWANRWPLRAGPRRLANGSNRP